MTICYIIGGFMVFELLITPKINRYENHPLRPQLYVFIGFLCFC
jgi:hypothetical protein